MGMNSASHIIPIKLYHLFLEELLQYHEQDDKAKTLDAGLAGGPPTYFFDM